MNSIKPQSCQVAHCSKSKASIALHWWRPSTPKCTTGKPTFSDDDRRWSEIWMKWKAFFVKSLMSPKCKLKAQNPNRYNWNTMEHIGFPQRHMTPLKKKTLPLVGSNIAHLFYKGKVYLIVPFLHGQSSLDFGLGLLLRSHERKLHILTIFLLERGFIFSSCLAWFKVIPKNHEFFQTAPAVSKFSTTSAANKNG